MSTSDQSEHDHADYWQHIGQAAEHFARRVARDANKFAARLEEHAGDFARDVSRDWRRARREAWHTCRQGRRAAAPEVRRVFEDIRTVLADVLDGVDELIERVFPAGSESPAASDADWTPVVINRESVCTACGRNLSAGEEAFLRRAASGMEFRCTGCGVPEAPAAG